MKQNKLIKVFSFLFVFLLLILLVACNGNKKDQTLPNIEGLTESQIREEFQDRGIVVSFDFKDYFEKNNTTKTGVKYGEGFNVGDEIANGTILPIYLKSNSITLPDLKGLDRQGILDYFAEIGVSANEISLRPDININVEVGTFISFGNNYIGERYDFSTKLNVYYDIGQAYSDLTGLNKYQIEFHFDALFVDVNFSYEVDNSKEFDLFKDYKEIEVGDRLTPGETVEIVLYKNDNVNDGNNIINANQLIISKYVDGLGNNRAIELYNPTANSIELSNYYLAILENASLIATHEIVLEGTINAGETYVVVKEGAEAALLAKANLVSNKMTFDGNDTIQLRQIANNTFIDQIYHPGNISLTMDEEVYVRKASVTSGNRIFSQSEWIGFVPTYLEPVGTHPWMETETLHPEFVHSDTIFSEYGMVEFQYQSAADGDTVYGVSLDPRDPIQFTGDSRIRFIMVDTPETQKPGVWGEPYAEVATNVTRTLLSNASKIYIQADPSGTLIDTYGRHLGLIWVKIDQEFSFNNITADGTPIVLEEGYHLLNFVLLKFGLGQKNIAKTVKYREAPIFSNRYLYQWGNEAENYAKENKLGIYSGVDRS